MGRHTVGSQLWKVNFAAVQLLPKIARKNRMLATTSTTEYTVLPLECELATSALMVRAKKLVKKISRHPCRILKQEGRGEAMEYKH